LTPTREGGGGGGSGATWLPPFSRFYLPPPRQLANLLEKEDDLLNIASIYNW